MGGLFFAGIYVALLARTSARGRMLFTGNLGIGIAVAALALATNVWVAAVLIFLAGAANIVANSVSQTMLMETAPVEQRGKVMNARVTLGRPVNTLGALFAGLLLDGGVTVAAVMALAGAAIGVYALGALAVPAVIAYEVTPPADEASLHA
jgi:MFS family permease